MQPKINEAPTIQLRISHKTQLSMKDRPKNTAKDITAMTNAGSHTLQEKKL